MHGGDADGTLSALGSTVQRLVQVPKAYGSRTWGAPLADIRSVTSYQDLRDCDVVMETGTGGEDDKRAILKHSAQC